MALPVENRHTHTETLFKAFTKSWIILGWLGECECVCVLVEMEHPACFHAEPVISISIHIKTTVNIIISESENGPIPFELRQCAREMSSPLPLPNVPAIHSYTLREWASNGIIQVQFWGGGEGNYGYYLRFGYAKRINILYFIVSFWFVSFHFEVGSIFLGWLLAVKINIFVYTKRQTGFITWFIQKL